MANKLFFSCLSMFLFFGLEAQSSNTIIARNPTNGYLSSITVPQGDDIEQKYFFQIFEKTLGLNQESTMKLSAETRDQYGMSHFRYKQYYKGYPVYGADYILHGKKDKIDHAQGLIIPEIDFNPLVAISSIEATKIAHGKMSNGALANLHNDGHKSENSINQLVVINSLYPFAGGDMKLAYLVELHSYEPLEFKKFFIDAHTGEVIHEFNTLMTCFGEKGTMETLYHGSREVLTEKEGDNFVTKDLSRGKGIIVKSVNGKVYSDSDNIWEAGSVEQKNGAFDLFWGAQSTYDFYKSKLSRASVDGNDMQINAILLDSGAYNNAFWDGTIRTINFGLGDNKTFKTFTALDVVGHELTHGVTQFSAGLEYLYESGAMNEAFSDIFGKSVEYYYDQQSFNWLIGGKVTVNPNSALRSMEDPNRFSNPKLYKGRFWVTGSSDNGGVHSNSGVLNYWFYLLSNGGTGKNELNKDFAVEKMGFDTSIIVAYNLLTNYLTPTSTYLEAKEACMKMVASWWGICSPAYNNVAEAWKAVGLGNSPLDNDLQIFNDRNGLLACKDGLFTLESRIVNNSCTQKILAGEELELSYKLENLPEVKEILKLNQDLNPGDHIVYTFSQNPVITKPGNSRIAVSINLLNDSDTSNNKYNILVSRSPNNSDHDFSINRLSLIGSACPTGDLRYTGSLIANYTGCSVVPAFSDFMLELKFGDSLVAYNFKNRTSVYPNGTLRDQGLVIPRNFLGIKKVEARLIWQKDTVLTNNKTNFQIVFIDYTGKGEVESFSNGKYDSTRVQIFSDSFSRVGINTQTVLNSSALVTTGSDVFNSVGNFIPVSATDPNTFIRVNPKFTSTLYLCADIGALVKPILRFKLIQKLGTVNYDSMGLNPKLAAFTRVSFKDRSGGPLGVVFYQLAEKVQNVNQIQVEIPIGTHQIEITNLCLNGAIDPVSGEISLENDIVVLDDVVIDELITSVEDPQVADLLLVPNPTNGAMVLFNQSLDDSEIVQYQILDPLGRMVVSSFIRNSRREEIHLPVNLASGQYLLKYFLSNGKQGLKKFTKI
ncbi:MAG: M4 family metallopeptidase [Saprospiraceae bacterium]|nr:M4 family metallopeptidase [Candidatus Vicinibacter affinis]